MLACANDHDSCLAVLIEFGCDLDIRDENGLRAEEIAAREGDTRCLQRIRSAIQRLAIASACGPTNAASSALRI
jgi:ankyrin repeat protein